MIPKHFSDEALLAWLDGEQNLFSAALVRRHLQSCWDCRSRLARLEAAAHRLAEVHSQNPFLPAERVEAARRQFQRRAQYRPEAARSNVWKRVLIYAAASSLCLVGAVGVWEHWPAKSSVPVPPRPVTAATAHKPSPPPVPPPSLPASPREAPLHRSPLTERMPAIDAGSGLKDEVLAWSVLHELGLCRGRSVQLHSNGTQLRLTGVVSSRGTHERLVSRLRDLGLAVRMELQSVDDVVLSDDAPPVARRITRVDAPGENLLRDWLSLQGMAATEVAARTTEIANASVMTADLAWSEAWALHDLATRFGPLWREMPAPAHAIVLSMARDHWSELQTFAARQRRLSGGILPPVHHTNLGVLTAAEQWTGAAQQLFAPAEPVSADPGHLTRQIASALVAIESLAGDDAALEALLQSNRLNIAHGR